MSAAVQEVPEEKLRKLAPEEIDYIVDHLPSISIYARNETVRTANESLRSFFRAQLSHYKIVNLAPYPHNVAVVELKDEFVRQFENARITPGDTVGTHSSESLGALLTQMALNSFHAAGARKQISTGVGRLRELVYLTSNPKANSCTVYFKNQLVRNTVTNQQESRPVSFEDIILRKQADLVEVNLSRLIKDYTVDLPSMVIREDDEWWYRLFEHVHSRDRPLVKHMMRLELNVYEMYAHRITMKDVCRALSEGAYERATAVRPALQSLQCFYSPQSLGILDIYPDEATIGGALGDASQWITDDAGRVFLKKSVLSSFDSVYIKGVRGISAIYPTESPVASLVSSRGKNQFKETDRIWKLRYEQRQLAVTGITQVSFERLAVAAGLVLLPPADPSEALTHVRVQIPETIDISTKDENGQPSKKTKRPLDIINEAIEKDEKAEEKFIEAETKKKNWFPRRPPTAISSTAKYVYVETDGTNLREILLREEVDAEHTVSNNAHEIIRIFGIEAARNFLIQEYIRSIQTSSTGTALNVRHILILVGYITYLGKLNPITIKGMIQMKAGPLAEASVQESQKVLMSGAAMGAVDPATSTSASIFLGQAASYGSGMTTLLRGRLDVTQDFINDQFSDLDPNEFAQSVSELTAMFGVPTANPEMASEYANLADLAFGEDIASRLPKTVVTVGPSPAEFVNPDLPSGPAVISNQLYPAIKRAETAPTCIRPALVGADTSAITRGEPPAPAAPTPAVLNEVPAMDIQAFLDFMATYPAT